MKGAFMMLGADSSDAPKNRETVAKVWSFALFFSLLCPAPDARRNRHRGRRPEPTMDVHSDIRRNAHGDTGVRVLNWALATRESAHDPIPRLQHCLPRVLLPVREPSQATACSWHIFCLD